MILRLEAQNLRRPRIQERYILWGLHSGDSHWTRLSRLPISSIFRGDSTIINLSLKLERSLDNVTDFGVSIELVDSPAVPGPFLMRGARIDSTKADLGQSELQGLDALDEASGSLVFQTRSSDTLRYLREFYFATQTGSDLKPSISGLPALPTGWKYGIWVIDSNYFPHHRFFYGFLQDATGPDSRSGKDSYPLPGGFEGPQLSRPAGSIRVTVEPPTLAGQIPSAGPAPYAIWYARLPKTITRGQTLELQNISRVSFPTGRLYIRKD